MPSALADILAKYRATAQTVIETGTYFEELIRTYFRYEASYADLYSDVWHWADWAKEIGTAEFGFSGKDTGIDTRTALLFHRDGLNLYPVLPASHAIGR